MSAVLLAGGCKPKGGSVDATETVEAVEPARATEELLAHLKLAGFAELGLKRWALFLLVQPGQPAEHLKLQEGQRQSGLEVLAIDPAAQTVLVRVGDLEETLSMATHGLNPGDGHAWLQRLSPDEHARRYNPPARQGLVEDHVQAHEQRQLQELARELEDRERLLPPPSKVNPEESK
jgi:hypothetical protein